jgi:50S ribosomal subunit-associated GTPase HflX
MSNHGRALVVGVKLKSERDGWPIEQSLAELAQLAQTAGCSLIGQTFQKPWRES